jgi:hypothetical protein
MEVPIEISCYNYIQRPVALIVVVVEKFSCKPEPVLLRIFNQEFVAVRMPVTYIIDCIDIVPGCRFPGCRDGM